MPLRRAGGDDRYLVSLVAKCLIEGGNMALHTSRHGPIVCGYQTYPHGCSACCHMGTDTSH